MKPFHVIIRALPLADLSKTTITLSGTEVEAFVVPSELQATPLGVSFEQAAEMFATLPRMHFEPDGSFVWVSGADAEAAWQLDGNLYDRGGNLVAVILRGSCSREHLARLLDVFRAGDHELMIEVVRDAVFIRESDFIDRLT